MAVGWSPFGSYSDTTFSRRVSGLAGCFSGMNSTFGDGRSNVWDMRRIPLPAQHKVRGQALPEPAPSFERSGEEDSPQRHEGTKTFASSCLCGEPSSGA